MAELINSSRYYGQKIDAIATEENGQTKIVLFYEFDDPTSAPYVIHEYQLGEQLDQLSYRYYARPDLWWAIAEYNPQVKDFFNIPPGTELRIPNV